MTAKKSVIPVGRWEDVQMVQKQSNRAAIYARASTDDQSCERQLRNLQAFAEHGGFEIAGIFQEKMSGTKIDREQRKCYAAGN